MIIDATGRDCVRLAELHALAFADCWSAEAFGDLLGSPGVQALLAPDGFIVVRTVADEAEILTLAVAPAARRAGLGRALASKAAEVAREQGAARLYLEVSAKNAAARALYAALGFTEIGRRARYYADGADALVLSLGLS
ncbi:MAG: GNAT family N-acetyltransferase [Hyphomonadaceae bacterium]|nr:MAG: ribosomal-protein-alanine N-acetyltransferase [Caulobacteraceae bacterium]MBT9444442.1 GNAT family N-acetyltransferase [Hyphomonadaceae bacterium]TPW06394.1 MAG: ribosomal-protein-alanine N-acetyltransferase [Alphaproteobacteria bacterium]